MSEPFTFYRALDPLKGSWDGYGYFPFGEDDFLAYVTDAPSAASIHTPELIKNFWSDYCRKHSQTLTDVLLARLELADGINRLQDCLQTRSRQDGAGYQATLSIARKLGSKLIYCSVGDSVLQLFRSEKLCRLNENEVWDGSLIIHADQALKERHRTAMLHFIGDQSDFLDFSRVSILDLKPDDVLVFCTDGVEDLLSPDRLIPLLKANRKSMRLEFEKIFAQEKLKDDVTFLAIDPRVPLEIDTGKEISDIQAQLDRIRSEQSQIRNDLARISAPLVRIEAMERKLQQVVQKTESPARSVHITTRSRVPSMWLLILLAFLTGVVAALGFLTLRPAKPEPGPPPVVRKIERAPDRPAVPPEIPPSEDCVYVVKKGDSLERIASGRKVTADVLLQLNPTLKKNSVLNPGQKIAVCNNDL